MSSTPQTHSRDGNEANDDGGRIGRREVDLPQSAAATALSINQGKDTLITLRDGSTILLKGVADVGAMYFPSFFPG